MIKTNTDSTKQYLKAFKAGLKLEVGMGVERKCLCWLLQSKKQQVRAGSWEDSLVTSFTQWVWSPMATAIDIPLDHSYGWNFPSQLAPDQPANHLWSPFVPIRTVTFCVIAFPVRCHYLNVYGICTSQRAAEMRQAWTPFPSALPPSSFSHTLSVTILKDKG